MQGGYTGLCRERQKIKLNEGMFCIMLYFQQVQTLMLTLHIS